MTDEIALIPENFYELASRIYNTQGRQFLPAEMVSWALQQTVEFAPEKKLEEIGMGDPHVMAMMGAYLREEQIVAKPQIEKAKESEKRLFDLFMFAAMGQNAEDHIRSTVHNMRFH